MRFIALSHRWGVPPAFSTTTMNIEDFKSEIPFGSLPLTFKHAVRTTRELGLCFLWIDSLCIVQGPGGDFDQESERMESVFSSAYCVVAASSALGQHDGFLKARQSNDILIMQTGERTLYASPFVDNFHRDVLEGSLSQRGWVLQERALARRTIYFTDRQTYWECGDGVRCETMAKMNK